MRGILPKKSLPKISAEQVVKSLKGIEPGSLGAASADAFAQALELQSCIAIFGGGNYRAEGLIERIQSSFESCYSKKLQVIRFHGSHFQRESSLSDLKLHLYGQDLFSEAKLIIISEPSTARTLLLPKLFEACKKRSDCLLVFKQCDDISDGNQKKIAEIASCLSINPLSGKGLKNWIRNELNKREISDPDSQIIQILAKEYGNNSDELIAALEKISLLTLPGEEIDLELVKGNIGSHFEKSMFELFAYIAKKDRLGSSVALKSILENGAHPLQVFAFLNKALKTLYVGLCEKSYGHIAHSKDLHNSWYLGKLSPSSFNSNRLSNSLRLLADLELQLKNNTFDDELFFDYVVQEL